MKKTSIIVHQKYAEDVIKSLYETGLMEIIDISKEEKELLKKDMQKGNIFSEAESCYEYELRLTRLIDILKKFKTKKGGIKSFLNPDLPEIKKIKERSLDKIFSNAEELLGKIEKNILELENEKQKLSEQIQGINQDILQLSLIKEFDLDISDIGISKYTIVKAGKTNDLEKIVNEINSIEKSIIFSKQIGTRKKPEWVIIIAAYISEQEKINAISRENISEFKFNIAEGNPKILLKINNEKLNQIKKQLLKIKQNLQIFVKEQLNDLLALREEIQLERVKKEISTNFAQTNSTYIVKGWILEKKEEELSNKLKKVAKNYIIFEFETPSENPDNPPTYIKTPRWAEGFKSLVSMFSLPRYNEINPTFIMGIFFIIFFGLMLGDAGYGLILLILSLFGYLKIGKNSDLIRDWSFMGIWLGTVTIIIGLLTNGFFGDLIPRFIYGNPEALLYNITIGGIKLPANPIKDPITILVIALLFGLVHLNIGVILGIIQSLKRKKYKEAFTTKFCWVPLQIGGGMLISYFILDFQLPDPLFYIAAILIVIGIILLFLAEGPIGFFGITGYVGDWLSYARLLALGLATTGMALAFNVVAQLFGDMIPFVGIIILILILIFAHLVNLGLQTLGAGIHSLRLQYVEFFNRFYEGGGHEFSPFKIKRKYTKLKEEK